MTIQSLLRALGPEIEDPEEGGFHSRIFQVSISNHSLQKRSCFSRSQFPPKILVSLIQKPQS